MHNSANERARYFQVPGSHLYTVLHEKESPLARVLLVGSFASERNVAYYFWVRWARYLAAKGIEVLRYDYRGIGESTGDFESMSFDDWREDVDLLSEWLSGQKEKVPIILHGMEMGALLAAHSFVKGAGDGLLLWAPPHCANELLRLALNRSAAFQIGRQFQRRKSLNEYIRQLEAGSYIDVQGYRWTSHLWRESLEFTLPSEVEDGFERSPAGKRPVRVMRFGGRQNSVVVPYPGFPEVKDQSTLYSQSAQLIIEMLGQESEGEP